MSEKPSPLDTIVNDVFGLMYEAIFRRDEAMVTPEVMRVAKALCHANGGAVDVLVISGRPCPNKPNGCDSYRIFASNVCMAWTPYVGQAVCAIANLERHREEEALNLKQQEETIERGRRQLQPEQTNQHEEGSLKGFAQPDLKAVDIPVGFSGMNDGGIKGEYRILDILDRLERGKKFRAEAGTETYIKMIEEDRNELLRRLIASKLVPPYTVPPRRSVQ